MIQCKEILLVLLVFTILYYYESRGSLNKTRAFVRSAGTTLLLWLGYNYFTNREMFRFEVTPWKQTCTNNRGHRCGECCRPGFNGQGITFDYTGDVERMNDSLTCYQRKHPGLKNRVAEYSTLGDVNQTDALENYSCCASGNDYNALSRTGKNMSGNNYGGVEGYSCCASGNEYNALARTGKNMSGNNYAGVEGYSGCCASGNEYNALARTGKNMSGNNYGGNVENFTPVKCNASGYSLHKYGCGTVGDNCGCGAGV